jgi:HSP20 family protein
MAMSNLTRYDPFSMEPVPDLFHGLFRPMRGLLAAEDSDLSGMKLDVTENETAYTVKAELPGVDKKDIDVKIDGNTVSIQAKVERNSELKEGERVIRRERYSGTYARRFSLASDIDESAASAQYQDGVLSLTLPKKVPAEQKRLQIG